MKLKKRNLTYVSICIAAIALMFAGYACDGGSSSGGGCNGGSSGGNDCGYVTCGNGQYSVTQNLRSGPSNSSGLWYPNGNGPFPVFVWGCGGGSQPRAYVDHFNQLASWGFIVVAEVSTGTGRELTQALDWLTRQNTTQTSVLYQKVDISRAAAGGHSMGSISTFAMADDSRLTTTVHVAGGSFDGRGYRSLKNPTIYISGTGDMALSNCRRDFQNTNNVPVFFTVMQGVDHIMAAREGLPAITAWLLWYLQDETQHKSEFLDANGFFQTGMWDSQTKNW